MTKKKFPDPLTTMEGGINLDFYSLYKMGMFGEYQREKTILEQNIESHEKTNHPPKQG